MKLEERNGALVLVPGERIDSANAEQESAQAEALLGSRIADCELVFDAENLIYISSAGLRMVLKLRKQNASLKVINASAEVYEIFEMTGFTEMLTVEKAFRKFSVDGCEVIGQGAKGVVYRYNDDTIVKVYKNPDSLPDIKNERALARRAFVLGIPTAISYDIVRVGESYGSVFELLNANSYSRLIIEDSENRDKYITEYALLLKKIHSTEVKPDDMPDIKITVRKWAKADEPFLSAAINAKIAKLIDETPDTLNMLHCDYHTNNVMNQNGETLLIDMDTLSHGHPVFELANVYITYVGFGEVEPKMVENFLGMPYETAKYIWSRFLPVYLGTEDKERINEVENKVKLLSYIRYLRHTVRRGGESEEDKKVISLCQSRIEELAGKVETLDF